MKCPVYQCQQIKDEIIDIKIRKVTMATSPVFIILGTNPASILVAAFQKNNHNMIKKRNDNIMRNQNWESEEKG